jgi:D-beta-D-heptose 7-phosphate kinase/D-beta-D-heptose 1-phosphate adenosyltransferase
MSKPLVMVSGGLDPIHSGHVAMILEAATFGEVVVVLNSDDWLVKKKGYKFMSFDERAAICQGLKGVKFVSAVKDEDGTVCEALERLKPDFFANGGDRKKENTPELRKCKELGIKMLWNIGGGKTQSSSVLVERAAISGAGGFESYVTREETDLD